MTIDLAAPPDAPAILERVRTAHADLRRLGPLNEKIRRLAPEAVTLLTEAGVFRMTMPRTLGGPELHPVEQVEIIEEASAADGSTGWCTMIGSDGGYVAAMLDPDVAAEMFRPLDVPTALVANPMGAQAVAAAGGFHVSGRWTFASGSSHASWFALACLELRDGAMQMNGDVPVLRFAVLPAAAVHVDDDWDTTGLRGTASNTVSVAETFVPEERTFVLGGPVRQDAPLYRHPFMFFSNMGGVPLGVARAAIDATIELSRSKIPLGSFSAAQLDPGVQERVARARALHRSSRSYLHESLHQLWEELQAGDVVPATWAEVRLATTNAFTSCSTAVQLCCDAAGSSGIFAMSPLDRARRDVLTMGHHVVVQPKSYVGAGQALLGLPATSVGF